MSRINDALKRAQKEQQINPPRPEGSMPRFLPIEPEPGSIVRWLLPGAIGCLVVAACVLAGMLLFSRHASPAAAKPNSSAPITNVVLAAIPGPASAPLIQTPAAASRSASPQPSPIPSEPKLQGIIYSVARPWAIVDGQTVRVGDRLGDFLVTAISPRDITLKKTDGSQRKLGLDK